MSDREIYDTPAGSVSLLTTPLTTPVNVSGAETPIIYPKEINVNIKEQELDKNEAFTKPLHYLDLPLMSAHPSPNLLILILTIIAKSKPKNFGPQKQLHATTIETTSHSYHDQNIPSLSLSDLTNGLLTLPQSEIFRYLTSIISSPLSWIKDEEVKETIIDLASSRLAERCGRTAEPDIYRDIELQNLEEAITEKILNEISSQLQTQNINIGEAKQYILNQIISSDIGIELKEPSLTADNLGLKTWGSSLMLSQRLVNNVLSYYTNFNKSNNSKDYNLMLKEPILELGAGTGLVGIACAKLGFDITLTDLSEIIPNLQHNVDKNHKEVSITLGENLKYSCFSKQKSKVAELDWTDPSSFIKSEISHELVDESSDKDLETTRYKTIILSDPIYSRSHPPWIINMLKIFLYKSGDSRVIIQLPLREKYGDVRSLLFKQLEDVGLIKVEGGEEEGYDDFGEQLFAWGIWKWGQYL